MSDTPRGRGRPAKEPGDHIVTTTVRIMKCAAESADGLAEREALPSRALAIEAAIGYAKLHMPKGWALRDAPGQLAEFKRHLEA